MYTGKEGLFCRPMWSEGRQFFLVLNAALWGVGGKVLCGVEWVDGDVRALSLVLSPVGLTSVESCRSLRNIPPAYVCGVRDCVMPPFRHSASYPSSRPGAAYTRVARTEQSMRCSSTVMLSARRRHLLQSGEAALGCEENDATRCFVRDRLDERT